MLVKVTGKINNIYQGRMIKTETGETPVIDFTFKVSRGNAKKRFSILLGKEFTHDYYKVTLFGNKAVEFYNQIGIQGINAKNKDIEIIGDLLQEEFPSKQTSQITLDNPLYPYFKQLVGQITSEELSVDTSGNIYIKSVTVVNRASINCTDFRLLMPTNSFNSVPQNNFYQPQAQQNIQGFSQVQQNTGFNPPQSSQASGFSTPASTPAIQGFTSTPQTTGFAQPGFNQPQPQIGFNQQPQQQGFAQPQQNLGYQPAPTQVAPTGYAGFGGTSSTPEGFSEDGFNEEAIGQSSAPANVTIQYDFKPTNNTTAPETNLPAPKKPEEEANKDETTTGTLAF